MQLCTSPTFCTFPDMNWSTRVRSRLKYIWRVIGQSSIASSMWLKVPAAPVGLGPKVWSLSYSTNEGIYSTYLEPFSKINRIIIYKKIATASSYITYSIWIYLCRSSSWNSSGPAMAKCDKMIKTSTFHFIVCLERTIWNLKNDVFQTYCINLLPVLMSMFASAGISCRSPQSEFSEPNKRKHVTNSTH